MIDLIMSQQRLRLPINVPDGCDGPWMSDWIRSLPASYFAEMERILRSLYYAWVRDDSYFSQPAGFRDLCGHIFNRMQTATDIFVPWIRRYVDLGRAHILEVGCGTGSVTVVLSHCASSVLSIDIARNEVEIARRRCDLLAARPEIRVAPESWLKPNSGFDFGALFAGIDAVVCYAVIEHLTIDERLVLLRESWKHLPSGGHLIVFETPNRLMPTDWHSNWLPFSETLPDRLLSLYLPKSKRSGLPDGIVCRELDQMSALNVDRMCRWGRAASFHEFDIAIGLDQLKVIADGYSVGARSQDGFAADLLYEQALASIFDRLQPPVPRGFARPSLDFILEKP
jgi:SAM-dependent methyltransferase